MKKILSALSLMLLLVSSCKKEKEIPTNMTGYFYTTNSTTPEARLRLFIDGVEKGEMPTIPTDPSLPLKTDDSLLLKNALKIEMLSGTYIVSMRDASGKIITQSKIYHNYYKNSVKSGVGWAGDYNCGSSSYLTERSFSCCLFSVAK